MTDEPDAELERLGDLDRLRDLGRWADVLARPDFVFGEWVPMQEIEPGVYHVGYYVPSEEAERFLADVARHRWVYPFDWMAWLATPEGRRLSGSPEAVGAATAEDLGRLLTAIIRGNRFSEGELAGAFESGMLLAITRRAQALAGDA